MIALDANLLVRLLTNDEPRQAAKVESWLEGHATAKAPAYIDHVVLCELAWVLERAYGYAREQVGEAVSAVLEHDQFKVEAPAMVRQALVSHRTGPAGFSDCLLAARTQAAGCDTVLTFDKRASRASTHTLLH